MTADVAVAIINFDIRRYSNHIVLLNKNQWVIALLKMLQATHTHARTHTQLLARVEKFDLLGFVLALSCTSICLNSAEWLQCTTETRHELFKKKIYEK